MKRSVLILFPVVVGAAWVSPALSTEVSFSGHYELKAFTYENVDLDNGTEDDTSSVEHELRLNMDLEQGPVVGRFQINSGAYVWGESQDLEDDEWYREMSIKFPLGPVTVKVGRMWDEHPFKGLIYVDVKDAIKLTYPLKPQLNLTASFVNIDDESDKSDNFYSLIGRYSPQGSSLRGAVGWYQRVVNGSTQAGEYVEDRPHWLAATLDIVKEPFSLSLTGAYLFGDRKISAGGTTSSYDYNAYAIDIRGGYDFSKASSIPLSLEAIIGIGSGDKNPEDRKLRTFQGLSPGYSHGAIFKDVGDPRVGGAPEVLNHESIEANGLGNQTMAALNLNYQATERLSLRLFGARFYLTEKTNANPNLTSGGTTYKDDHLGDEIAVTLDYSLAEGLLLSLQAAWFLPGNGMYPSTATATPGDTVPEYLAFIGWEF